MEYFLLYYLNHFLSSFGSWVVRNIAFLLDIEADLGQYDGKLLF